MLMRIVCWLYMKIILKRGLFCGNWLIWMCGKLRGLNGGRFIVSLRRKVIISCFIVVCIIFCCLKIFMLVISSWLLRCLVFIWIMGIVMFVCCSVIRIWFIFIMFIWEKKWMIMLIRFSLLTMWCVERFCWWLC